jgi:type II secretory pathway component PulJ
MTIQTIQEYDKIILIRKGEKMSKENNKQQMTAAQRLLRLEDAVSTLDQVIYNQAQQFAAMREALALLNEKVSAMVTLLSMGQTVSDSSIDQVVEQKRIEEMKKKVEDLIKNGSLEKAEEVTKKSFVVVREINSETGAVINPRLQFVVNILNEESLQKLLGKKAGESVKFVEENPAVIEIEEIYNIITKESETEKNNQNSETEVSKKEEDKKVEQAQEQPKV